MRVKLPPTMLHTKHKVKRGLATVTVIHFKSSQRKLCVQVYKDYNASWLNLQESQVSVESTLVIFSISPPVHSATPVQ